MPFTFEDRRRLEQWYDARDRRKAEFCTITGLRASDATTKAYPPGWPDKRLPPGSDHVEVFYHPTSKGYVLVDQPYGRTDEARARAEAWARETGWQMVQADWGSSIYGNGTEMYLWARAAHRIDLGQIANRLKEAPTSIGDPA